MREFRIFLAVSALCFLFTGIIFGNELGIGSWSDPRPLFTTSIFSDWFSVNSDSLGTSFLSVDGAYFREVDLTYRLVNHGVVEEEIIISAQKEMDNPFVLLDSQGARHLFWLERKSGANALYHSQLSVPYTGHEVNVIWETANIIQDLSAFQMGDTTHLAWSERDTNYQIRYGQIHGGQLTSIETLTDSLDASIRPSIAVSTQGVPHVVWYESSSRGVEVYFSKRNLNIGWSQPRAIGKGSVQDIERRNAITLYPTDSTVYAAWSASPTQNNQMVIQVVEIGPVHVRVPISLVSGTRPRFLEQGDQLLLTWQAEGEHGSQVYIGSYHRGAITEWTHLTVGRNSGLRPELISKDGYTYIYWLKANPERSYHVFEINNQFPRTITFWDRLGIDKSNVLTHLAFLIGNTIMLSLVFVLGNMGLLLIGVLLFFILHRFKILRKRSLFFQVMLVGTVFTVARYFPIPKPTSLFLGLIHYGLSFGLASAGTYFVMKPVKDPEHFAYLAMMIVWLFLFQLFALLPHNILI